jgi:flagellar basal-body rod protein FlgB
MTGKFLPVPAGFCRFYAFSLGCKDAREALRRIGTIIASTKRTPLPVKLTAGRGEALEEPAMAQGDGLFGIDGTALRLRSQRLNLLASNIANAATPGYRARDIDFSQALSLASRGQSADQAASQSIAYRVPTTPSLDGNTVELSTEQTLFAENAVQYRATLSFLEGRISTIRRAWKGE